MELENMVDINEQKELTKYFSKNDYKNIKSIVSHNRMNTYEDLLKKACYLYKENQRVINYTY